MQIMRTTWGLIVLVSLFIACGPPVKITGTETPGDPTTPSPRTQAETRITVASFGTQRNTIVAFNDETGSVINGTIVHSPGGRQVFPGASEAGFSWSPDDGVTWTYGGTIPPIPGWPVIWSDPGATTSRVDQHFVFLSYLAVPDAKFPYATGFIDGAINNFIGGACVMRSVDGGMHFSVYQCFNATDANPNGDFYDGTSMASADDGSIYFTTNDVDTNQTHVWKADSATSLFVRMPDPFPGTPIINHSIIHTVNNEPYVLAPTQPPVGGSISLLLTRFHGGIWPVPATITTNAAVGLTIPFSGGTARRGEEYSFDIGVDDAFGHDAIRVAYTAPPAPFAHINVTRCDVNLALCLATPGWGSPMGTNGDIFSPTIKFFNGDFSTTGPIWKIAWMTRAGDPTGNTFGIDEGNLILSGVMPLLIPFRVVSGQPVCASTTTMYFGDYDDLGLIGLTSDFRARFIRTYTDSTLGCSITWPFTAWNQHVSAIVFP